MLVVVVVAAAVEAVVVVNVVVAVAFVAPSEVSSAGVVGPSFSALPAFVAMHRCSPPRSSLLRPRYC